MLHGCVQFRMNGGHTRDAMVGGTQPRNRLEERKSENDVMPTNVWKE